jgi:superfamily II DNA or RNA helicase
MILEAKSYRERQKQGQRRPFEIKDAIVVTSYEFGALKAPELGATEWDLIVFDEAHRLRNVFCGGASKRATPCAAP